MTDALKGPYRLLVNWPTARIPGHLIVASDSLETAVALVPEWGRDARRASQLAVAHEMAASHDLREALEALGTLPDGYCFCPPSDRDASKPEHCHTGECRAARAALRKAKGGQA